jgi:hypothetical protein
MQRPEYKESYKKAVRDRDLDAITWVNTVHPGDLSRKERHLFWVLLSLLRLVPGAELVRCTVDHLAAVHRRVGLEGSPSTIRRALASLEALGFLSRRRCRLGPDRLGLLIEIHRDRWQFWLKRPEKPPTSVYIPPRQSVGPGVDRTSTTPRVDLPNRVENRNKPQESGQKKVHRYHPIVYSLMCLLKRQGAPDRQALIRRAEGELALEASGLEVVNHSGVPWAQFERAWREMGISSREPFAAAEIVPRLRAALERPDVGGDLELLDAGNELGHDSPVDVGVEIERPLEAPCCDAELATVIRRLVSRGAVDPSGGMDEAQLPLAPSPLDAGVDNSLLDAGDLELLLAADRRTVVRRRAEGGEID